MVEISEEVQYDRRNHGVMVGTVPSSALFGTEEATVKKLLIAVGCSIPWRQQWGRPDHQCAVLRPWILQKRR